MWFASEFVHSYDMAPIASAEERVAGRFRPTKSALPVKVDKVPADNYASLAWQDPIMMIGMQWLSIFTAQFTTAATPFVNSIALSFFLGVGRLPLAHSWPFLAHWRVAFQWSPAGYHAASSFWLTPNSNRRASSLWQSDT